MDIYEKIRSVDIIEMLNKLGLKTFNKGTNTLGIYDGQKKTDGWTVNLTDGFIKDFTGKRAEGDKLEFVCKLLGIDKGEGIEWFKTNFGLYEDLTYKNPVKNKIDIKTEWDKLSDLTESDISYLTTRGIDYEKIKGIVKSNNGISCLIKNELGKDITIQTRSIIGRKFCILPGTTANGCYYSGIDKEKDYVYVVEGLFDFLSLRQFDTNVVGLMNAKTGIEVIKSISKKYKIIFIPDNDSVGKETINIFKQELKEFYLFDIGKNEDFKELKDVNDLLINTGFGKGILDLFKNNVLIKEANVAIEKFYAMKKKVISRGKLGYDSLYPMIDKYTQGIIEGRVYTIGAYSNVGKSKFSYSYVQDFLKKGKKVLYFSLEVDSGTLIANLLSSYYSINYFDTFSPKFEFKEDIFKNLKAYDNVYELTGIENIAKQLKPDIIFIDFIQNLQVKGAVSDYNKMTTIVTRLQALAIETGITIFNLSQINNESRFGEIENVTLKGSGAIFASSDIIFMMQKDKDNTSQLNILLAKNKYGPAFKKFLVVPDFGKGTFDFKYEIDENYKKQAKVKDVINIFGGEPATILPYKD